MNKLTERDVERDVDPEWRTLGWLAAFAVWTLLIGGATFSMQMPQAQNGVSKFTQIAALLLGIGIYLANAKHLSVRKLNIRTVLHHCILMSVVCAATSITATIATYYLPLYLKYRSITSYEVELEKYKSDESGFKSLKQFANDYFSVNVILANHKDAWADAQLEIPTSSKASMRVGAGFCELRILPSAVKSEVSELPNILQTLWLQGVGIHELGHCIDARSDISPSSGQRVSGNAIAPQYRTKVVDLDTYAQAWQMKRSVRWREAIGDLMTAGYWRINAPSGYQTLMKYLIEKRTSAQNGVQPDDVHDTACWLRYAMSVDGPDSNAGLFAWATTIRNQASCI